MTAMQKLRDIYSRRLEIFMDSGQFPENNIYSQLYERRDGTAVSMAVWSVPMDGHNPPKFIDAIKQEYSPVQVGDSFGPSWSTHWFRVTVKIPKDHEWDKKKVVFRWNCECEALIWSVGGTPLQGLSEQERHDYTLTETAIPGQEFDFYLVNGIMLL